MGQQIITVRASSFGTLFDCAHRFEGEQLLKLWRPSSLRAWLGTSIHAGSAAFDQAKLDGDPISATDAADVFYNSMESPTEEVDFRDDKLTFKEASIIGATLNTRYCLEMAPTMQYESVEKALTPLDIDCDDGLIIRLTGKMDRSRVIRYSAKKIIGDLKTGSRLIVDGAVSIKGRAAQLGTYQLLSEHTDGEPTDGAQIMALQTTTATKIGVSKIFNPREIMVGTDNTPGLIAMAAKMFKIGLFPPNPQSVLCDKKYCARWGTCKYHE